MTKRGILRRKLTRDFIAYDKEIRQINIPKWYKHPVGLSHWECMFNVAKDMVSSKRNKLAIKQVPLKNLTRDSYMKLIQRNNYRLYILKIMKKFMMTEEEAKAWYKHQESLNPWREVK